MKEILFRANGSSKIGLGHLYRTIALASILKNDFKAFFLVSKDSIVSPLINANFPYDFIPSHLEIEDEPDWINSQFIESEIIVLDGYNFSEKYQIRLRGLNKKVVFIDDLIKGVQKADVVINHSPGAFLEKYKTESYTKLALGLNYAILREPFLEEILKKGFTKSKIHSIFISFGGSDFQDFTYRSVINLVNIDFLTEINVLVGAGYQHKELFAINDERLKIYRNIDAEAIVDIMKKCDLALASASTVCMELAALKKPVILGYYVENQKNLYDGFVKRNAVFSIGDLRKFDFVKLQEFVTEINGTNELSMVSNRLISMFRTYSKDNLIGIFKFKDLEIENANETHLHFTFNLSNDEQVRLNSYNSNTISFEEHKKWFNIQLNNDDVIHYIVYFLNVPIGQVRFSIKEDHAIIGISILPEYRGKGLAKKSLSMAVKKYFLTNKKPIHAYIKMSNLASTSLFEKAGFKRIKQCEIEGFDSFVYKIDR